MSYISIGDMAQTYQMRRHHVELQKHLTRLSKELASGQRADLAEAVSGDFKALAGLERSLGVLQSFETATSEAALFGQSLQTVLGNSQAIAEELAPALLMAATSSSPTMVASAGFDARQKLEAVVSNLNTEVADRFLLSGDATDRPPLASAQDILTGLTAAIGGQTTASGVAAAVAAWFDAPAGGGGFIDQIYGGSATALAPFRIGENETAALDVLATDPAIRDTLEALALGALVDQGALAGDVAGQSLLIRWSGEGLVGAADGLAHLRARVGTFESAVSQAASRNAAQASALTIARNEIVAADPYETASALELVQTQVETLYTLTARLSRMSLADVLR
ncbi:flagellin [Albidovulum sp.]